MTNTVFSLIPPILAIIMVIVTKRVLLSLGVGIVSAALILAEFNLADTLKITFDSFKNLVVVDGGLNTWNIYIILFLLILGVITAFISINGGSQAFGDWAMKRVKTRVGAKLVGAVLGIIIFIDDYFNALAVGQVSRPITDRHKISRAKLAYIIDSTSAPVCVISPVSSWGAYIIALLVPILAAHQITEFTAFSAFVQMIPLNFYVLAAIPMVYIVAVRNINLGGMKEHEERAIKTGQVLDPSKTIPGEIKSDLASSKKGKVSDLVLPILALVAGTVGSLLWTGYQAVAGKATILKIFENTDVAKSLFIGGMFGLLVVLLLFFRQAGILKAVPGKVFFKGVTAGAKSMLPAVFILIFAWSISDLIGRLETGAYLAGVVQKIDLNIAWLPAILFIISGLMAFATGTSWGTFGILLPIAGDIAAATDITILLALMAAVLAGSVFGDHTSPISDTTILSSTGAGCNHIDHVLTQLPYALLAAGMAIIGFLIIGFTGNMLLAMAAVLLLLTVFALFGPKLALNGEK